DPCAPGWRSRCDGTSASRAARPSGVGLDAVVDGVVDADPVGSLGVDETSAQRCLWEKGRAAGIALRCAIESHQFMHRSVPVAREPLEESAVPVLLPFLAAHASEEVAGKEQV